MTRDVGVDAVREVRGITCLWYLRVARDRIQSPTPPHVPPCVRRRRLACVLATALRIGRSHGRPRLAEDCEAVRVTHRYGSRVIDTVCCKLPPAYIVAVGVGRRAERACAGRRNTYMGFTTAPSVTTA
jgi:hypothetical protein